MKNKFLKTFSFFSLALLMGMAGVFAFVPLGTGPSVAGASTVDSINTKADGENIKYAQSALGLDPENDPVIYTTESGLEIKYGGVDLNNSLPSGKFLTGYPYFTMGTYSGYAVNWVIIGRNTNDTVFLDKLQTYIYSAWKSNTANSATYQTNGSYFFDNVHDGITPAGNAVDLDSANKAEIIDLAKATKTVVGNDEVPEGCVLAISECCLGYSYFNSTSAASSTYDYLGVGNFCGRYRYISTTYSSVISNVTYSFNNTSGTLFSYIQNLYNNNLNLSNQQKTMIQGQKLKTLYTNGAQSNTYLETYETDGKTLHKLFPMAGFKQINTYSTNCNPPGEENFIITTYLTDNNLRKAYAINGNTSINYWLRSSEPGYSGCAGSIGDRNTSGDYGSGVLRGDGPATNWGVRPACVIKLG